MKFHKTSLRLNEGAGRIVPFRLVLATVQHSDISLLMYVSYYMDSDFYSGK